MIHLPGVLAAAEEIQKFLKNKFDSNFGPYSRSKAKMIPSKDSKEWSPPWSAACA